MRNCADKSVPKKNLRDVWEEVHLPIRTAGWNGVRIPKSLFATSLCVVSELREQCDFKIDIQVAILNKCPRMRKIVGAAIKPTNQKPGWQVGT